MYARDTSPAVSENEVDISNSLSKISEKKDEVTQPSITRSTIDVRVARDQGRNLDEEEIDDEAFIAIQQAASNRKSSNLKGKTVKKGGGFQAMGLNPVLLKAIARKGFDGPTPIQRRAIPILLDGQDAVGMARTGSGKTAAFVIPMIEKLKSHTAKVGVRALILSPSRELALQTLKVVKELGRGTSLRAILVVGGDSLEDQFAAMATNPDIIIGAPGRFVHLQVEMGLDLSSVCYVVFDEADRLFEMGFAGQLNEILHALPPSRQTSLFSATLPKTLVEFTKAGLREPTLVRLDVETKISPDLQSAFLTLKSAEKEGALLYLLQDVIQMPLGMSKPASQIRDEAGNPGRKRKRASDPTRTHQNGNSSKSTIIFTATKHHVEYLASMLQSIGYDVSFLYSSLDQAARKMQAQNFRDGITTILVVTDVAARGVDIPLLTNVINYDFPTKPKLFIHRVGRTARAGRQGWSYNFVSQADLPYLIDLQLFLGRRFCLGRRSEDKVALVNDVVVGAFGREELEKGCELAEKIIEDNDEIAALRVVSGKGERRYNETRPKPSTESQKRAKSILSDPAYLEPHIVFSRNDSVDPKREEMLARVSNFRPQETIFEVGKRGNTFEAAEIMRNYRRKHGSRANNQQDKSHHVIGHSGAQLSATDFSEVRAETGESPEREDITSYASEDDMEVVFPGEVQSRNSDAQSVWQDSEHFMSYVPYEVNIAEDQGYGIKSGASSGQSGQGPNFLDAMRSATMDLTNDESRGFAEPSKARGMRWDKKAKKYVSRANDEDGSRGKKYIRGESGQKIAASFRSGRFDAWRKAHKIDRMPRTGETEKTLNTLGGVRFGKKYQHSADKAPKAADRFRDDFYVQKRRIAEAKERRVGQFKDGLGKSELRNTSEVRKQRALKEKRRQKNARPSKRTTRAR
ncbi:MAG: ATP-dependent RNA helicase dbp10 [Bogoriella megaspora]|nr:MAG: ATP-dependent RNA helicase dbp10 [Bogoriella megaspora]